MKNNKGITLVEVLAVMAVLFVVSSLLFGVLTGMNKHYNHLSKKNNLNQEANLLLATLKNYHFKDELHDNGKYKIMYSIDKSLTIGTTTANIPLHSDGFTVETLRIDDRNIEKDTLSTISSTSTIKVYIELVNSNNQSYIIDTNIKRY